MLWHKAYLCNVIVSVAIQSLSIRNSGDKDLSACRNIEQQAKGMGAVSDLVSNLVCGCLMYKTSRLLDSRVQSLTLSHEKRIFGIKSGIQDCYSHWFERSAPGLGSVVRVNVVMNRGQKIVHPLLRKWTPGQIISTKKP